MEKEPGDKSHMLWVTQDGDELSILFGLSGVTLSYYPTHKPTKAELAICQWFDLTPEEPDWDPQWTIFWEQDHSTVNNACGSMVHEKGKETWDLSPVFLKCRVWPSLWLCPLQSPVLRAVLTKSYPNLHDDYYLLTSHHSREMSSYHLRQPERGEATLLHNDLPRTGV